MSVNKPDTVRYALGERPEGVQAVATDETQPIDYSDIPELDDSWFAAALQAANRPAKRAISLRVDEDVLAFFKAGGGRYQTRMNAVLRAWMVGQRKG